MKKRTFKWAAVGVFLLSFGILLFNAKPEDGFRSEGGSVPVAAFETTVQQPSPVVEVESTVVREADDNTVLVSGELERETMLSNGQVERRRLVMCSGTYPNRLVIETYVRNAGFQQYEPVSCVEMVADQVLVRLRETATQEDLVRLAEAHKAMVVRVLSDGKTFVVRLSGPGLDAVDDAVAKFSGASAEVAYAEPDFIRHLSVTPNDPMVGNLWGMAKISMPDAWSLSTGNRSAVVAVLDTGVDMDHSDLVANLWINSGEIAGDGVDNDGNGQIDDVNGWDFLGKDNNPDDTDGHGTHCAGTIGAVGNNGTQVAGVCWTVSIMPVRIGTEAGLADSDIVDGIRYAARNGAKVLSNSYGGTGFSQTTYDAIAYAYQRGCIFVAAAGNAGEDNDAIPQYPASYDLPNIISVAATDENDALANFSNYGATSVDLAAPGVNIVSTYPGSGTETLQGTSMACPHVAGALGLLMSENANITPEEAKQILLDSVDPVDALAGKLVSGGRLNVYSLFSSASDLDQDGIPDSWEELNGLDPNDPLDALLDPDGDFLSNLQEFKNACDPNHPDSDGDSLIDGWEVHYGFNPGNVHGALPKLQYLGFNDLCQDARDVALANGYAYVADGQYGLKVLDLSDPAAPVGVGSYSTGGSARSVSLVGSRIYLSDAEKGLLILDVSNPASPQLMASLETSAYKTDVQGNYAYVAAYTNGLKIASIADPANPQWVGQLLRTGMEAFDVKVVGTKAYVGIDGALIIVNVAMPSKPSLADSHINGVDAVSVESVGNDLLVAHNPYGVMAYNSLLNLIGEFETPGDAQDVCYDGGLIYVADGSKGLQVLDGSDLTDINPYSAYSYVSAYAVAVSNGYVYVAGKESGLQIFQSSPDADEDGLSDAWEMEYFGSLAQLPADDFDADGINNWGEYLALLSPINADQDNDGLVDGTDEVQTYNTDPRTADTDGDTLSDYAEIYTHHTDPVLSDTDGDGMSDNWEVAHSLNPLVDDSSGDADLDGASNLEESKAGTNPKNADSDSDGIPDGWEIDHGLNPLEDDASLDTDGDTLSNAQEYAAGTDPLEVDTDQDDLNDADELNVYHTNPNESDTDGDGMPDGWEVETGLDPTIDDSSIDTDGDTLSNQLEYRNGSSPSNADTDDDGFSDLDESNYGTDATNAADPIFVDDDHAADPQPYDPLVSNADEDGSINAPFDSIQEAIDAAVGGSTVLVTNGYYIGSSNRNIDPKGKAVSIIAYSSNPMDTVIDADGLGAAFLFQSGETTNTLVKGFSITSPPGDCSDGACGYENGLVCKDGSSPYIQNCYVYNCAYDGIFCSFASSPVIDNVEIASCGGGVSASSGSVPRIMNSFIHSVGSGISVSDGDGLMVSGTTVSNCSGRGISLVNSAGSIITNCLVVGNLGGFSFEATSSTLLDTLITNNVAPDYYTFSGVQYKSRENIALYAANTEDTEDVTHSDENGGGILLSSGSTLTLKNCVLGANRAVALDPAYPDSLPTFGLGGALYIGADCYTTNINCTYADNEARRGGGISSHGTHADFIRNTILWGNTAEDLWIGEQTLPVTTIEGGVTNVADVTTNVLMRATQNTYASLQCRNGAFDVWYSDVEHGGTYVKPYKYVIDQNPLFAAGYALSVGSPCIDVGTVSGAPLVDMAGVSRPQDGDADGNAKVDLGAVEFVHPVFAYLAANGLSSPVADDDSDGVSNLDEFVAGTAATDSASYFYVSFAQPAVGGGFDMVFDSVLGRSYTIYRCQALGDPWTILIADVPGNGGPLTISDTSSLPNCFYKVEVRY